MLQKEGMYKTEHLLAWLFAIGAIILAVIGALAAFDVISLRTVTIAETPLVEIEGESGTTHFRDGLLLILPAIALGILAWTMHSSEHHVAMTTGGSQQTSTGGRTSTDNMARSGGTVAGQAQSAANRGTDAGRDATSYAADSAQPKSGSGTGTMEHALSYLGLVITIALGVIAVLVGFNVFDDGYSWRDGIIWAFLAIFSGVVTATLHSVQHHAMPVYDVDDIRVMVEERVGTAMQRQGAAGMTTAQATAGGMAGTGTGTQRDMPGTGTGTQRDMPGTRDVPGTGGQGQMPNTPREASDTMRDVSDNVRDVPGTQGGTSGDRDIERPL
jgi:hypothetical protein